MVVTVLCLPCFETASWARLVYIQSMKSVCLAVFVPLPPFPLAAGDIRFSTCPSFCACLHRCMPGGGGAKMVSNAMISLTSNLDQRRSLFSGSDKRSFCFFALVQSCAWRGVRWLWSDAGHSLQAADPPAQSSQEGKTVLVPSLQLQEPTQERRPRFIYIHFIRWCSMPSVLWHCWLGSIFGRNG